jgi:broad specificity phosphatase PhoE
MHVFIRHGRDKESKYGNDGDITREAKKEIREKTEELIQKYGMPDIVYYSPYYRAYQTMKQMKEVIREMDNTENRTKFIVDPKLGRFVTSKERRRDKVRRTTLAKGAIIDETISEFHDRIKSLIPNNNNLKVWYITHAVILVQLAKIKKIPFQQHVEYLDTLKI